MFIDITGERFDRLLALEFVKHPKSGRGMWLCLCDCGRECLSESWALRHRKNRSCGCHRLEQTIARSTKHGHRRKAKTTNQYYLWRSLKVRGLELDFRSFLALEKTGQLPTFKDKSLKHGHCRGGKQTPLYNKWKSQRDKRRKKVTDLSFEQWLEKFAPALAAAPQVSEIAATN